MPPIGRPRSCHCGTCFKCKRADYMRGWWNKHTPEEKRAKTARRDPEKVREQARRKMYKRRHFGTPEQKKKIAAQAECRRAILRGDLIRGLCEREDCGEIGHAHHDDYDLPLEVRWLCQRHHLEEHGQLQPESEAA